MSLISEALSTHSQLIRYSISGGASTTSRFKLFSPTAPFDLLPSPAEKQYAYSSHPFSIPHSVFCFCRFSRKNLAHLLPGSPRRKHHNESQTRQLFRYSESLCFANNDLICILIVSPLQPLPCLTSLPSNKYTAHLAYECSRRKH